MNCPYCNAQLAVDGDKNEVECPVCKSNWILDKGFKVNIPDIILDNESPTDDRP